MAEAKDKPLQPQETNPEDATVAMTQATPTASQSMFPPGMTLASVVAGGVVGTLALIKNVSLASLVFSGELSGYVSSGIGLVLVGATIVACMVAMLSSVPTATATPQDTGIAVLAVVAAAIMTSMPDTASAETKYFTVIAACVATTILSGACFLALGIFRLGNVVRFIPHPVVGGFMAGAGWLIVSGAMRVMTTKSMTWLTLSEFAQDDMLARWGSGLALALLLLVLVRVIKHYLVMPIVIVASIVAFYVLLGQQGHDIAWARDGGWLLGPFHEGGLWKTTLYEIASRADWVVVYSQAGQIGAIVVVSVLALLLNSSSLELALKRDINLNRELFAAGVANLVCGGAGGMIGYQSLSMSRLTHDMGARTRLGGIAVGVVAFVALLVGQSFLTYLPRPVVGGMLLYMGLDFLYTWVVQSWRRLPGAEYGVVILILLATSAFGFLFGVGLGIMVTAVLFLMTYSRVSVVRQEWTVKSRHSDVERSNHDREVLRAHGEQAQLLSLQGFLFFGTAHQVLEAVRGRVADRSQPTLRYALLDFRLVTGIDSSTVLSFDRLNQVAAANDLDIVLVELSGELRKLFESARIIVRQGAKESDDARVRALPGLNAGIEWIENQILAENGAADDEAEGAVLLKELQEILGDSDHKYLRRREFRAGEYLMHQGDESKDVQFLISGQVTIRLELGDGKSTRIRVLRPGTVVGEMGLYRNVPRSASAVADTDVVIYYISRSLLMQMVKIGPQKVAAFHQFLARMLAERLTDVNATLRALLE